MRNVLIVGFLWPYLNGSKRVIGLAKYLGEFGWKPHVLTPRLPERPSGEFKTIETEYIGFLGRGVKLIGLGDNCDLGDQLKSGVSGCSQKTKSLLRWSFKTLREIHAYPDEHKRWRCYALAEANKAIEKEPIAALLSVWPVTSHIIAGELKLKHGIPWVADFADLWSDNSAYPYGKLRKSFDRRLERKTIIDADFLTTSSSPLAKRLSRFHSGRQVYPIMLGYDPALVNRSPMNLLRKFTITYTGIFYPEKRDPHVFLKALQELIAEGRMDVDDIQVRFYGTKNDWVGERIRIYGLGEMVTQYGNVPLEQCIERQRESHVLLQVNWSDKDEKGVFSGKLLDYLAARRPILAVGGTGNDDVVIRILRETDSGVYKVTKDEIKNGLDELYNEYRRYGTVLYRGNKEQVERYSNRSMAKEFSTLLNDATDGKRGL